MSTSGVQEFEAALHDALPSNDPIDQPNFNPIEFINQKFPNEQSLSKVDSCLSELKEQVRTIDCQILGAVRGQATSYSRAQKDLAHVKVSIKELLDRIQSMRRKAAESEGLVDEISRDVKTLDNAKRNLTATITALKRLVMLVTALDKLRCFAAEREYRQASHLVLAINQLDNHFSSMTHVPKIQELLSQKASIYDELQRQILEDFDAIFDPDQDMISNLHDACLTVDAMSPLVKRDIITTFCLKLLEPYKKIFQPPHDESGLECVDRRYAWFKRNKREYEETYGHTFPAKWHVQRHFAEHFCHITRQHLVEVLGSCHHLADPMQMVRVLRRSIEFENSLAQKYEEEGDSMHDMLEELEERDASADAKRLPHNLPYADTLDGDSDTRRLKEQTAIAPRFKGIISECFEAYLGSWVRYEELQLLDALTKATGQDTILGQADSGNAAGSAEEDDDAEEDLPRFVYSSASEVFAGIKLCLKRAMTVSTQQVLFEIFQVFKRILRRYVEVLTARMPKKGAILGEKESREVCCVVGTAEYCEATLPDLAAAVVRVIDKSLVEGVNFEAERDAFWTLKANGISVFVGSIEARLDPALLKMQRSNWVALNEVVDHSSYVSEIVDVCHAVFPLLASHLSVAYFRFFCDKFVQMIVPKFVSSIFACGKISELGAQQLLLDTYSLKTTLLEVPVVFSRGRPVAAGYSKFVLREMGCAEVLLKVLTSSVDDPATLALLGEYGAVASAEELTKILNLKTSSAASGSGREELTPTESGAAGGIRRLLNSSVGATAFDSHTTGALLQGGSGASDVTGRDGGTAGGNGGEQQQRKLGLDFQSLSAFSDTFLQSLKASEDVRKLFGGRL